MKKLVVEYIPSLGDGGAETLVKDYTLLLNKEVFDVKIVVVYALSGDANTRRLNEKKADIIKIYPHWNIAVHVFDKLFRRFYVPHKLKKILKMLKPDILHVHLHLLDSVRRNSCEVEGCSLFYTCHNETKQVFSEKQKKEFEAADYLIRNKGLHMIALHDDMKEELDQMFHINNTAVIRNGIDFTKFMNVRESREEIREALGIPRDTFVVGHVGRFYEQKNHVFLVEIFRELCKQKQNAYLLMIGAGRLQQEIERRLLKYGLETRYQILAHRSDIPQLMRAMDVFVFPSLYEGFPLTLVEAQVSGLRCIVSSNISQEAFLTDECIPMSLDSSAKEWCNATLDSSIKNPVHGDMEDHDMNKEIKRLEKLYLQACNE